MPSISRTFLSWMKDYDSRLSAKFSYKTHCFIVEHTDAKGQKYSVIKAHRLDNRVKESIIDLDMQRFGGALKYLDNIEKQEWKAEKKRDEAISDYHEGFLNEAFDHMNVVQGERFLPTGR